MDWDRLKLYHGCTIVDDIFCRTPIVDKMYKEHSKDKNLNEYIYKKVVFTGQPSLLAPNCYGRIYESRTLIFSIYKCQYIWLETSTSIIFMTLYF